MHFLYLPHLSHKTYTYYLLVLSSLLMSSCFDEISNEEDPKAYLRVIHNNSQLPNLDIIVDGERISTVDNGEISTTLDLELGSHQIKVRNEGASKSLDLEVSIDMEQQDYVVAVSGTFEEPTLIAYDRTLPALEEGIHWVGLFDLTRILPAAALYRESDKLFDLPIDNHVAGFVELSADDRNETLSVILNQGGAICNPPLTEMFNDRDASIIVIRELEDDQGSECVMERLRINRSDD